MTRIFSPAPQALAPLFRAPFRLVLGTLVMALIISAIPAPPTVQSVVRPALLMLQPT